MDGNPLVGVSPIELELERGPHDLRLRGPRIMPVDRSIDVTGYGKEQRFEFSTEPSNSTFAVQTQPDGSEILLDGVLLGRTAYTGAVDLGKHEVEVRLDGYHSVVQSLTAEPNSLTDVGVIQLKPMDAVLSLSSAPTGASVLVDNEFVGTAPLEIRLPALRTHELTIRKSGYEAIETGSDQRQAKPFAGPLVWERAALRHR